MTKDMPQTKQPEAQELLYEVDDAIALLKANLEYYPKSSKTLAAIGFAYTRKYDDETAISYLEKAVELDPNNGVIAGQLLQLKSYRRRK